MTSETQHIVGQRGGIIRRQKYPLSLEDCRGVTVMEPDVEGGHNCIEFLDCIDCKIVAGTLSDPEPVVNNPNDPESHCVLFNNCIRCSVVGTMCVSIEPTGDKVNFFNGSRCTAKDVTIIGPVALHGTAAIIDGPIGSRHLFMRLVLESKGNVNVCGGSGHILRNFVCKSPIEWTPEYYQGGRLVGGRIEDVTAPRLYLGPGVVEPEMVRCKFDVIEMVGDRSVGDRSTAASPRRPAGWSVKKFKAWLRKKGLL